MEQASKFGAPKNGFHRPNAEQNVVKVNARQFRSIVVELLVGDTTNVKTKLDWIPLRLSGLCTRYDAKWPLADDQKSLLERMGVCD